MNPVEQVKNSKENIMEQPTNEQLLEAAKPLIKLLWRAYGQPDGTVVCDECNFAADVNKLIDSAKREALKELPFTHDTMGFCEHFGKQFRPCAKCVVDERLAQLKQSKESE